MAKKNVKLRSDLGWSTASEIRVRGFDLCNDLMGRINLGDMAFLELAGRLPTTQESVILNACLVTLVEHGITPSALATRFTYLGAPEALQGAVAAGLLGLGTVFVGTIEGSARILQESLRGQPADADLDAIACQVVQEHRERNKAIPGLGHPVHKPDDPRTLRLFALAAEHGLAGRHVDLMGRIRREAEKQFQKVLPINATGAIGALVSELGFPWQIARGFGVMARAIGLVAHISEEMANPMARELWFRVEDEATEHVRPR